MWLEMGKGKIILKKKKKINLVFGLFTSNIICIAVMLRMRIKKKMIIIWVSCKL